MMKNIIFELLVGMQGGLDLSEILTLLQKINAYFYSA